MINSKNVLLYLSTSQDAGKRLQNKVNGIVVEETIVVIRNMEKFLNILRHQSSSITAAVILTSTEKELVELLSLRNLLHRIPVVLILPNQEKDTITKGHSLRPRFISYADSDFSDVRDVFSNIMGKIHPS